MMPNSIRLGSVIDHTLLKADATAADIDRLCAEAVEYRLAAVCVNPQWVGRCLEAVTGHPVAIASVVAFPLGASDSRCKAREAGLAVDEGAVEVDMVASLGAVRAGNWDYVARDIAAVVAAAPTALVKVIVESALLSPAELVQVCKVVQNAGAGYVKTSTGFHAAGGATTAAVALMRTTVGDALGVKASGGIRDAEAAFQLIANGATRIGTSAGAALADAMGPGPRPVAELFDIKVGIEVGTREAHG
ncbi:MAG TPA: deoxyribose-phosphate aldolase [Gemmatimonadaceae bacterium]|jgi:deoxyribose-phosphate aldolase|nr:deoxyribose-phosphate aldolase [Gemmatimonadaceae bacterium]